MKPVKVLRPSPLRYEFLNPVRARLKTNDDYTSPSALSHGLIVSPACVALEKERNFYYITQIISNSGRSWSITGVPMI